ncbi:MAG: EsaB/YukD family protein [Eubacterium sp.]|nr:EsaB/YukD family protein [Eubacterium sp.]MDD7208474.1 EsaB/YukD family protein [Lachnospiraceae bacterium]MDY5497597.1 EsaB/YukD family protein [Anaerobutyricum sp.]
MMDLDVYVASAEKWFEIRCDEKCPVRIIVESIWRQVKESELAESDLEAGSFWLCCVDQERVLNPEHSLEESGIRNGYRLMLI